MKQLRMPDVGDLHQRVTLLAPSGALDELGQSLPEWQTVGEVWASAQPLRAMAFADAGAQQAGLMVRFSIRYRKDVAAGWRVLWKGRPYDLESEPLDLGGRGLWLEFTAKTVRGGS